MIGRYVRLEGAVCEIIASEFSGGKSMYQAATVDGRMLWLTEGEVEQALIPLPDLVTEEEAAYRLSRILAYDEQIANVKRQSETMLARLRREKDSYAQWYAPLLEAYYDQHRPTRGKTLHLSTGSLSRRTEPARWHVTDDDALVMWAQAKKDRADLVAIKIEYTVPRAPLYAHIDATGEIPAGVEWRQEKETFNLKGPKS